MQDDHDVSCNRNEIVIGERYKKHENSGQTLSSNDQSNEIIILFLTQKNYTVIFNVFWVIGLFVVGIIFDVFIDLNNTYGFENENVGNNCDDPCNVLLCPWQHHV